MTGRKTKSISFDLTDAFERDLLEYAEQDERGKFSRYIKRLIADDKENRYLAMRPEPQRLIEVENTDKETMQGFL